MRPEYVPCNWGAQRMPKFHPRNSDLSWYFAESPNIRSFLRCDLEHRYLAQP